jgi:acetyl-CoA acetyltransferase
MTDGSHFARERLIAFTPWHRDAVSPFLDCRSRSHRFSARITGYAHAGVDPEIMGVGPIHAVRKLLDRTEMKISDFDLSESNEAFASQACAVARELGFPDEQTNPNGGAIALGHPIGATGSILTVKAIHELARWRNMHFQRWSTTCARSSARLPLSMKRWPRVSAARSRRSRFCGSCAA